MKTTVLTTILSAFLGLMSCDNNAENKHTNDNTTGVVIENEKTNEETRVQVNTEQDNTVSDVEVEKQRQEFRTSSEARIEQNDLRITELERKADNSSGKVKKEYKEKISILKERNAKMKEKLKGEKESGKDKWNEFKREFNHDMDELGKALDDFATDNKK